MGVQMPRGPLPKENARRRNAPTIPGTQLPVAGFAGQIPESPYVLAQAGGRWWRWAWRTPQACAWDAGSLYVVARRAQLEDELSALEFGDFAELTDLLAGADPESIRRVEFAISSLKRVATGSVSLMKEMRELDNRLGLNPKALIDLRWRIAPVEEEKPRATGTVTRLRAVDPGAVAG